MIIIIRHVLTSNRSIRSRIVQYDSALCRTFSFVSTFRINYLKRPLFVARAVHAQGIPPRIKLFNFCENVLCTVPRDYSTCKITFKIYNSTFRACAVSRYYTLRTHDIAVTTDGITRQLIFRDGNYGKHSR